MGDVLAYAAPFALVAVAIVIVRRSQARGLRWPWLVVGVWFGLATVSNALDGPHDGIPRGASAPVFWLVALVTGAAAGAAIWLGLRRR